MKQLFGIAAIVVLTVAAMAAGAGIYKWTMATPIPPEASKPTLEPSLNVSLIRGLLVEYLGVMERELEEIHAQTPGPTTRAKSGSVLEVIREKLETNPRDVLALLTRSDA